MIRQFCKGLPYYLRGQLIFEYDFRMKELAFLLKNNPRKYQWIKKRESIELLIAMSIFYNRVIAYLESGARSLTDRPPIQIIKFGQNELTKTEADTLQSMANDFYGILGTFGLPIYIFDYSDVKTFLYKLKTSLDGLA